MTVSVHCSHINNLLWNNGAESSFTANEAPDIWQIAIDSSLHLINEYWLLLNADEQKRANRYYHVKDKHRFIISRGYLRVLLGKYLNQLPAQIQFGIGENKKPHIKNTGLPLHYNVSHSENYILIAIALSEIGIDVEKSDPDFLYNEVLKLTFSNDEIIDIQQSDFPIKRFYTLWTRKEALLKATGKGIDDDLLLIPCLDGPNKVAYNLIGSEKNWFVSSFKIDEQYIASIASSSPESKFWKL